ncbi:MAG TPA: sugar ABC transporter ATP-binding protein [bacterium]|nr:sugar ABC transporter ATP-binding protein [bacterium]
MSDEPIVRFEGIVKKFPGIVALSDVNLSITAGSCHGLVGENGAGKSTLGKILAGIHPHEGGKVFVDGKQVKFSGPVDALNAGIGIVHQELAFCENMSIAENLCLQKLPSRGIFVSRKEMKEQAKRLLATIDADLDVDRPLGELTVSQQQLVQIAAAVGRGAKVIIFDEPTSSLSQHEAERLFALIKDLQKRGVTSIYVSHRIKEIFYLCDTITVLRDGKVAGTRKTLELDENSLVELMIGRRIEEYFPAHLKAELGEELLRVENLSSPGKFSNINFSLRAGEVLGFAGLVGAGRTEISEALFGLDPNATGDVYIKGRKVEIKSATEAVSLGLGLVPEDRKRHGLVLLMSCKDNLTLPILERISRFSFIKQREEKEVVNEYFKKMRVRARSIDALVASLSGGNQQKIVLARWLAAKCGILALDEPTRGVDVGAKAEIHSLIDQLAKDGAGVLLISSELPEVINLSTRILVLRHGKIASELSREKSDQDTIMRLMAGLPSAS